MSGRDHERGLSCMFPELLEERSGGSYFLCVPFPVFGAVKS